MVKKQNNNVWIVYVIALIAIVALILSAVAISKASVTGQGIFNFRTQSNIINAHSCNADGVCEIQGKISAEHGIDLIAQDVWIPSSLGIGGATSIQNVLTIASLNANASNMIPTNPVSYVCVDAYGNLFKKQTPCV